MQQIVPNAVLYQAQRLGVDGDNADELRKEICRMILNSAPVTHPQGNRRYDDWIFYVHENVVKRVHLIKCQTCDDRKRIEVQDECERCAGTSCMFCHNKGYVVNMIPCPSCAMPNYLTNVG